MQWGTILHADFQVQNEGMDTVFKIITRLFANPIISSSNRTMLPELVLDTKM